MTISADEGYILTAFKKILDIAHRLQKVDPAMEKAVFEAEYDRLLGEFYTELLHIDEVVGRGLPPKEQLLDHLESLISAGRCYDELWDAYHSDRLDLIQFSKLFK